MKHYRFYTIAGLILGMLVLITTAQVWAQPFIMVDTVECEKIHYVTPFSCGNQNELTVV